jgi:hypothetical protein
MTTIVPMCVPVVSPQVDAAPGENFAQNGAPMPSESYTEIHTQSDETGAKIEEDSEEHSSVSSDPKAATPGTLHGPASCSAPVQRHAATPPASPARPSLVATPASTPPSMRGMGSSAPSPDTAAGSGSRALSPGSAGSSAATSHASTPALPPPPPGPRTHLQQGIRQPKKVY